MEFTLPILYKLTSKGKVQQWKITVDDNVITREFGLLGGTIQKQRETISEGKNIGRSNETTSSEQAIKEAKSDWENKLAKDYFQSIEEAKEQIYKTAKEGGYLPMLAQCYKKHGNRHLKFPCYVQPKVDGIRGIATKIENNTDIWFRSGKRILTLPNINTQLNKLACNGEILDGELYIHGEDFNEFTGAIRANRNLNEQVTSRIEYHMYDVPRIGNLTEEETFAKRFTSLISRFKNSEYLPNIKIVETHMVNNFKEAEAHYERWISEGYEGMIFRNMYMPYEQKRSYNLLKYKDMIDEEFKIIEVIVEDRIDTMKHYKVVCITEEGVIVTAKMKGTQQALADLFRTPNEAIGKMATIQYFGKTPDGSLRFPIAKTIRFDLD